MRRMPSFAVVAVALVVLGGRAPAQAVDPGLRHLEVNLVKSKFAQATTYEPDGSSKRRKPTE